MFWEQFVFCHYALGMIRFGHHALGMVCFGHHALGMVCFGHQLETKRGSLMFWDLFLYGHQLEFMNYEHTNFE
jgi:hypothetical protein